VNRRQFSQCLGAGALGGAGLPKRGVAASRSEKKEWAHEHLRGLGGLILPSFTPDFKSLDEEAVRLDVRHSIRQGFTSCTVSPNGANAEQT
jgi:hypothetical protein